MYVKNHLWLKYSRLCGAQLLVSILAIAHIGIATEPIQKIPHPRLYFTAADLPHLRDLKKSGMHAKIWANLKKSADWCARQTPRTEWIPTVEKDPQFENLYDRFYAAMHDAAIVEHLAFASALSDPNDNPYFEPARKWLLAAANVWKN